MSRRKLGFIARRYGAPKAITAAATVPEAGQKRKRGRPRKIDAIAQTPLVDKSLAIQVPAPSGPGRFSRVSSIPAPSGTTVTPIGSILSRQLCLHFLMTHPVSFREYMIPKISARGYWHRYHFGAPILAARSGDTFIRAGRASGKSFAILEPEPIQHALTHPGEETLLTALRKLHIVDRMERIIAYLETPVLARYVKRVKRSPIYIIEFFNGHVLYGASVGDDPDAKMIQGKHVSLLCVEEAHQFPLKAWTKVQGAKDMRGCRTMMIGVPDGRQDSAYRLADTQYPTFRGRRFQISRRWDPRWTQTMKANEAVTLGGVTSDLFKQEVDAEWGNPTWSAWDMESLYRCMTSLLDPAVTIKVDGTTYRDQGWTHREALIDLPPRPPGWHDIVIAADIGYTQPTEIGVLGQYEAGGPWSLLVRIELANRMEHDAQSDILWALVQHYTASSLGVDATEGEGRALATDIDNRMQRDGYTARVEFGEKLLVRTYEDPDTKEMVEELELAKALGTRLLRAAFAAKQVQLPHDEQIVVEFNKELEQKTQAGVVVVRTPNDVHIPDMLRVFILTLFLRTPDAEGTADYAMPEIGVDPFRYQEAF